MPCAVLPRWRSFPKNAVFALVLGISVRGWGIFALALEFPVCAGGVAFWLRLPVLRLGRRLRWLALRFFTVCLIPGYPCVVVWVLCDAVELCLTSLLLLCTGQAFVGPLAGVCLYASSCGACGFHGVSCRRLPLGGYASFLAPYVCPAPAVELCLWGLWCLYCGACFPPCDVLFLWHLRFCAAPSTAGYP